MKGKKLSVGGFTAAGVLLVALLGGAVGGAMALSASQAPAPAPAGPVTLHQVAGETAPVVAAPVPSAAADEDAVESNSEPEDTKSDPVNSNSSPALEPAGSSAAAEAADAADRAEDAAQRAEDAADRAEEPAPKVAPKPSPKPAERPGKDCADTRLKWDWSEDGGKGGCVWVAECPDGWSYNVHGKANSELCYKEPEALKPNAPQEPAAERAPSDTPTTDDAADPVAD